MSESVWFAIIAVLAFSGWAVTLIALLRSALTVANSHKVLQQIVEREDKLVESMVARLERRRNPALKPSVPSPAPQREPAENSMARLFGVPTVPTVPIFEQPESGEELEVAES